jgi:hypothetical protein
VHFITARPVDYGDSVQFHHTGLAQRSIIVPRLPLAAPPRAPLAGSPGGRGALSQQALYARLYRLDVGGADDLTGSDTGPTSVWTSHAHPVARQMGSKTRLMGWLCMLSVQIRNPPTIGPRGFRRWQRRL